MKIEIAPNPPAGGRNLIFNDFPLGNKRVKVVEIIRINFLNTLERKSKDFFMCFDTISSYKIEEFNYKVNERPIIPPIHIFI